MKLPERKYLHIRNSFKSNKIGRWIMGRFIPTTAKRELLFMAGRNFLSDFM